MVDGEAVIKWIQYRMQEYCSHFSEGWGRVHEYNSFLDDDKRELTAFVIYFPQAGATGYRVQDSCLFCNRGFAFHRSAKGEGRDEATSLPAGAWSNCSVYHVDDGSNKGDSLEVYKRGDEGLFPF